MLYGFYKRFDFLIWFIVFEWIDAINRDFWRRHKRKVFITAGVLGSGYFLYKLYAAHSRRISELESQLEGRREIDELIKSQLRSKPSTIFYLKKNKLYIYMLEDFIF